MFLIIKMIINSETDYRRKKITVPKLSLTFIYYILLRTSNVFPARFWEIKIVLDLKQMAVFSNLSSQNNSEIESHDTTWQPSLYTACELRFCTDTTTILVVRPLSLTHLEVLWGVEHPGLWTAREKDLLGGAQGNHSCLLRVYWLEMEVLPFKYKHLYRQDSKMCIIQIKTMKIFICPFFLDLLGCKIISVEFQWCNSNQLS